MGYNVYYVDTHYASAEIFLLTVKMQSSLSFKCLFFTEDTTKTTAAISIYLFLTFFVYCLKTGQKYCSTTQHKKLH
jgi:hypothetical protein